MGVCVFLFILFPLVTNGQILLDLPGIEDVLHENAEMKEKIKWLEDVIRNNITDLMSRMETNEENDRNQDKTINDNEVNASKEIGSLSQNLVHLEEDLIPGIGSIIPWIPSPDGLEAILQSKIPTGWQKCDGSQILSGPMINLRTPDLNGQGLFLRGGEDSLVTTVQEDMVPDHAHIDPGHTHTDGGHSHTDGGHTHTDAGHAHTQSSHYHHPQTFHDGGTHHFVVTNAPYDSESDLLVESINDDLKEGTGTNHYYGHQAGATDTATPYIHSASASIQTAHANIHSASASIRSSKSGVSTVADQYKKGHENRPKNMVVTYIMRIF